MQIRPVLILSLLLASSVSLSGQHADLSFQLRTSASYTTLDGDRYRPQTGFGGERLSMKLNVELSDKFYFSWFQNFNKPISSADPFNATDWITLEYRPNDRWSFVAGKLVPAFGGWEYWIPAITVYMPGEYWMYTPFFQFGAGAEYSFVNGRDHLSFQLTRSPWCPVGRNDVLAAHLLWVGDHDWFHGRCSLNALGTGDGPELHSYLGGKFMFGKSTLELDLIMREGGYCGYHDSYSTVANYYYTLSDSLVLMAKETTDGFSGGSLTKFGAGAEYYPIKDSRSLRFYALGYTTFGSTSSFGITPARLTCFSAGILIMQNIFKK